MFDTVILLTGPVEEAALTALLRKYRPELRIFSAKSGEDLAKVETATLARARLIGFVTPVLVPASILGALGYGAYNFHPGPPQYPGWSPSHFAIYDGARHFGATAHVMVERVDAGPIVAVGMFPILPGTGVLQLEELAFLELARLFWALAPALATQDTPLPTIPIEWAGTKSTRRLHATMCEIPADVSRKELERRITAFGKGHFGIRPRIILHGYPFHYLPPEIQGQIDAPNQLLAHSQ